MSDDPTTSSPTTGMTSSPFRARPDRRSSPPSDAADDAASSRRAQRLKKRRQAMAKKRSEFLRDLEQNLDVLIYAQLCLLYYMDISFTRLIARAFAQVTFLTPKPSSLPPLRSSQPYVVAILGPNIVCMLLHLFCAPPAASEATRGYIHGGIIMDFIGQKAPVSRLSLLMLDCLVLVLQCVMLAVHTEAVAAKKATGRGPRGQASRGNDTETPLAAPTLRQLDVEERGVPPDADLAALAALVAERDAVAPTDGADGDDAHREDEDEDEEQRAALLAEPAAAGEDEADEGPYDFSYTGMTIVGDFHILQTMRNYWVSFDAWA